MKLSKLCKHCGDKFYKKSTCSNKDWENKSKYCSVECSRLNTCFNKGITPWSKSQKGVHLSPKSEFKKGMTPWNKGLKGYRAGKLNNHWKGGITPIHEKIRKSPEYIGWRNSVYERDDYTCQKCNQRGGVLNAHHIKEFCNYKHLRMTLENGITLCEKCHKILHNKSFKAHLNQFQVQRVLLMKEVTPYLTYQKIADMFNVTVHVIKDIMRGRSYKWVGA